MNPIEIEQDIRNLELMLLDDGPVDMDLSPQAVAGDILAIRGKGFFSEGILRLTNNTVSHVGLVIADHPVVLVTEALWRVKTRPMGMSIAEADAAYILHPRNLTSAQVERIVWTASAMSANGYGVADIGFQLLDVAFRTTFFTDHNLTGLKNRPICSFLVAAAYASAELVFGKIKEQSITPAEIYGFCVGNPQIYSVEKLK